MTPRCRSSDAADLQKPSRIFKSYAKRLRALGLPVMAVDGRRRPVAIGQMQAESYRSAGASARPWRRGA